MLRVLFITTLVLNACQKKTSVNPPTITSDLAGTWNSTCMSNIDHNTSTIETITFLSKTNMQGSLNSVKKYFSDTNCKNLSSTKNDIGYYQIEPSALPSNIKAIDFQITTRKITPNSDDFTTILNNKAYCGVTWVTNATEDISGKNNCGDKALSVGTFNVYFVDGLFLSFGDTSSSDKDGSSADKRPTSLNPIVYTKK